MTPSMSRRGMSSKSSWWICGWLSGVMGLLLIFFWSFQWLKTTFVLYISLSSDSKHVKKGYVFKVILMDLWMIVLSLWQGDRHQLHELQHLWVFSQHIQWKKWQEQQLNCVTTTILYTSKYSISWKFSISLGRGFFASKWYLSKIKPNNIAPWT